MRDPEFYILKLPRVADEHFSESGPFPRYCRIVNQSSPAADRNAAECLAWFFKREFSYDFVQYLASERGNGKDCVVLLTDRGYTKTGKEVEFAYGAICMRWRTYSNHEPEWAMTWVWLHPYERNKGHLSDIWQGLETRFPGFRVEPPLSPAMHAFLTNRGELHRTL